MVEKEKPLRDVKDLKSKWTMKHIGLEDKELFSKLEEVGLIKINGFIKKQFAGDEH